MNTTNKYNALSDSDNISLSSTQKSSVDSSVISTITKSRADNALSEIKLSIFSGHIGKGFREAVDFYEQSLIIAASRDTEREKDSVLKSSFKNLIKVYDDHQRLVNEEQQQLDAESAAMARAQDETQTELLKTVVFEAKHIVEDME